MTAGAMPRILDRYVLRELGAPLAISVGVFTFFLVIDRIYQLTDLVITKQVPVRLVLFLLVFLLPPLLSLTLPIALLLAVLISCGRLAGDFEVAALKASGVSPLGLLRPFLAAGVVVTLVVASLTLVVNPWAAAAFQSNLFEILQSRALTAVQEGTFNTAFSPMVLYVREVSPSQVALRGVLASDERDQALSRIVVAREGRILSDQRTRRVTLRFIDGSVNETDAADPRRFRHTTFSIYDMNLELRPPGAASKQEGKPEKEMSLGQLMATASVHARDRALAVPYRIELHKRFAMPVAALVFVLVAFPLGIHAQRGGRGAALALGFAIMMSYYTLSDALDDLPLSGKLPVAVAIWLPNVVFGLLGLMLLRAETIGLPKGWLELAGTVAARLRSARLRLARGAPTTPQPARLSASHVSTFVVDRYLLREYLLLLGISALIGSVLTVVVDLFQSLDRFLRSKPPWAYIAQHFLYLLPRELYKGLPLIVLVSTVFLFLSLTRQRELDALKAAGVSLYRACVPVLAMALCISLAALLFQEMALPEITVRAEEVDRVKIRGFPPRHLVRQGQIWYRSSDTRFLRIALLDPATKSLDGLVVLDVDPGFRLLDRLDVAKAQWTPEGWLMSGGILRKIGPAGRITSTTFAHEVVDMPERADDFIRVQKLPDTMSFLELRAYVAKLRSGGYQVGSYLVQLHSKLAFPLVHVIMALVAIPFALNSPRSGGRAMGIGVALVIAVGYWMVDAVAVAFGRADLLPPILAAWTANIVFAGVGTVLLLKART
jgi:LPS export ABC transporter permease LptF/LPS export ABC transporter permease LptG